VSGLLQFDLILGNSILLILILVNIIRSKLQIKYSLLWIFSSLILLLLAIFPSSIEALVLILGIKLEVNAIYLLMLFFLYAISISLTFAISRSSMRIRAIAQELALIKSEVSELKKKLNIDE
jgi:hypothetical protein